VLNLTVLARVARGENGSGRARFMQLEIHSFQQPVAATDGLRPVFAGGNVVAEVADYDDLENDDFDEFDEDDFDDDFDDDFEEEHDSEYEVDNEEFPADEFDFAEEAEEAGEEEGEIDEEIDDEFEEGEGEEEEVDDDE
jgi:hypothetical protein